MAQQGKIGYIDALIGVYRVHSGGFWSGINKAAQVERVSEFYRNMNRRLDYEYRDIIDSKIAKRYRELDLQSNGLHRALVTLNDARLVKRIRRISRLTVRPLRCPYFQNASITCETPLLLARYQYRWHFTSDAKRLLNI